MPETLVCGLQYSIVIRDDLDKVTKWVEDTAVRQFHIAKQRVLRAAG